PDLDLAEIENLTCAAARGVLSGLHLPAGGLSGFAVSRLRAGVPRVLAGGGGRARGDGVSDRVPARPRRVVETAFLRRRGCRDRFSRRHHRDAPADRTLECVLPHAIEVRVSLRAARHALFAAQATGQRSLSRRDQLRRRRTDAAGSGDDGPEREIVARAARDRRVLLRVLGVPALRRRALEPVSLGGGAGAAGRSLAGAGADPAARGR